MSMEKAEDTSSKTPSVVSRDQPDLRGPNCPSRGDSQDKSVCQAKGKPDDEEDEGLAQNSSIEDAESIQSSSETEKQGDSRGRPSIRGITEIKDIEPKGTHELLNGVDDERLSTVQDRRRKLSLDKASAVCGNSCPERQSPKTPTEAAELSEEDRQKQSYEAEVKSWLMERIQAPIAGQETFVRLGLYV